MTVSFLLSTQQRYLNFPHYYWLFHQFSPQEGGQLSQNENDNQQTANTQQQLTSCQKIGMPHTETATHRHRQTDTQYVRARAHTHTHARSHARTHARTHTHTHTHTEARAHTSIKRAKHISSARSKRFCIKMGSDKKSHFNATFVVKGKVPRLNP